MNTKQPYPIFHNKRSLSPAKKLQLLANAGWTFAKLTIFSLPVYNNDELPAIQKEIKLIYASSFNAYDSYVEFCQRMLLAMNYYPGQYCQTILCDKAPSWFRSETEGYIKTRSLYEDLLAKRKQAPSLHIQWKALAEAVLDITEIYSEEIAAYWTRWFKEREAEVEAKLFIQALQIQNRDTRVFERSIKANMRSCEKLFEASVITGSKNIDQNQY